MRQMLKTVTVPALVMMPLLAQATPLQSLQSLLAPIESLQANFVQTSFSDLNSTSYQQTSGSLAIAKPDLLYWYAAAPFEQTIVADGDVFWVWDKDLEQVTMEPVGDRIASTPAGLLTTNPERISQQFRVELDEVFGEIESYALFPVSNDELFEKIVMTFEGDMPSEVEIHDVMGGATMLMLENVSVNGDLDRNQFVLDLPADTDVIDMTQ